MTLFLYVNTFARKDVKIRHSINTKAFMTQDNWHRMTLRIPLDLTEQLRKAANNSNHSLTSEIVKRLSDSCRAEILMQDDLDLTPKELANKINLLVNQISSLADDNTIQKDKILSKEESRLLKWFNSANKSEQVLLISSLPELLSFLKKLS